MAPTKGERNLSLGSSILANSVASIVGECLLIWSVLNLLPFPAFAGGELCMRIIAIARRRNVHSWLISGGPLYVRLISMCATLGLGAWIGLRAIYCLLAGMMGK